MQKYRPVMLVVLDGWGWREEVADNAIRQARTPNFDHLWGTGPHALVPVSYTHLDVYKRQPPASMSACPKARWAIPRSATSIWAPAAS